MPAASWHHPIFGDFLVNALNGWVIGPEGNVVVLTHWDSCKTQCFAAVTGQGSTTPPRRRPRGGWDRWGKCPRRGKAPSSTGYRGPAPWHVTSSRSGRLRIGYMGLRSVTALEIAGPVGADDWALAAARLCARHAAARHFVLEETASGRLRLVDVASVVGTSRGGVARAELR